MVPSVPSTSEWAHRLTEQDFIGRSSRGVLRGLGKLIGRGSIEYSGGRGTVKPFGT